MIARMGIAATLLATALAAVAAPALTLIRDGQPAATIIIAGDAPDSVRRAATELQDYLGRASGAQLPLLTDVRPETGVSLFVGESALTRSLGVTLDGIGPDGYRWQSGDDWLAIVGRDQRGGPVSGMRNPWQFHEVYNPELRLGAFGETGTLYGVYQFLERFCGVRWFMPGELGTVVPAFKDLSVGPLAEQRTPDFSYRYPWFCNFATAPDEALWYRRAGFGGVCPVQAIDSFSFFLKYKDEHPEYFALVDGQRDTGSLCCITGGGNLCLSNEDLLRQMAADIGAYFDSHPDQQFYPVAPNDGMTRVCGCEKCAPQVEPGKGKTGHFSNYIWGFVNRLAAEVARTHPGRNIGTIAYEGYLDPPDAIERLHPAVAVMVCQVRGSFPDPERRRVARDLINRWHAKTDQLYLWEYYRYNLPPFPWCPAAYPHAIAADLSSLKGVSRGEFVESESWQPGGEARIHYPAMQHLNLYVTAKCLWDANLDVDALLTDYVTRFYGPAAEPMGTFWQRAEALHNARPEADPVVKYPCAELDALLKLLERAVALTTADTAERRRVELVRADVRKLRDTLGAPLVRDVPALSSQRVAGPIQVDGDLGDPGWQNSLPQGFVLKNGEAAPYRSLLVSTHDATHLYVGIVNIEPQLDKLIVQAAPGSTDANVWADDCIEVFISPDAAQPARSYQLVVNAAGAVWDGAYGLPEPGPGLFGCQPAWRCAGLRVAVGRSPGRWTVELAIPWAAVGLAGDLLPERVALNAYRARRCGAEPILTAWSPPLQEAHYTPLRFGTVWLKPEPAPVPETACLLPRSTDDVGSGAAAGPGWYIPGGVLDGKPFVGNPNTLTRLDRMLIRFDLAPLALRYGTQGVRQATLRLLPLTVSGPEDVRRIEFSHLQYDSAALEWKDIVSDRVDLVGTLTVRRDTVCRDGLSFDVTAQVNADLAQGRLLAPFRLRDLVSEEGNPDMLPDGLCFPPYPSGQLKLLISTDAGKP
jgi:hypothetical protein